MSGRKAEQGLSLYPRLLVQSLSKVVGAVQAAAQPASQQKGSLLAVTPKDAFTNTHW